MMQIRLGIPREAIGVVINEGWLTLAWVRRKRRSLKDWVDITWLKKAGAQQSKLQVLLLCQRPIHTHSTESLADFFSSQITENIFSFHGFNGLRMPRWWCAPAEIEQPNHSVLFTLTIPAKQTLSPRWGEYYLRQQGYLVNDWLWDADRDGDNTRLVAIKKEWVYRFLHPLQRRSIAPTGITLASQLDQNCDLKFPYAGAWLQAHCCSRAINLASRALSC